MVAISGPQLRAARGMLDWTREQLAKEAGISQETIKNIEHGIFRPQESTTSAIIKAFAIHDVVFTESEGVQVRKDSVIRFEGVEGFKRFMDDVYAVAQLAESKLDGSKPFYLVGLDDRFFIKYLGDFFTVYHVKRMNALKNKFKMRILVKDRPHTLSQEEMKEGSYREYRVHTSPVTGNVLFYVYGDKLAILVFEGVDAPQIVVVTSSLVAKAYREQFETLWNSGEPLNRK